ncbi:MAG: HDOD domain-containing protein [Anaerolineales bacterium]|nr:HDOD domain-containing protein [Anaerolineales bacterium]
MIGKRVEIHDLVRRVGDLPPVPMAAEAALAVIRNPSSGMVELAEVLSLDQALASLVVRWANSAYFGLIRPINTVREAVVYLGYQTVQSLILGGSLSSLLERAVPGYGLEKGELWKHSIAVAAGSRLIVRKLSPQKAEEAYLAGLLCDIGKLAMEVLLRDVDTLSRPAPQTFVDMERDLFGFDHAQLGAEIARKWNLPSGLINTIEYHHRPSELEEVSVLVDAVHASDCAAVMMGIGIGNEGLEYELDPEALQRVGLEDHTYFELMGRIGPLVREAETFLELKRSSA